MDNGKVRYTVTNVELRPYTSRGKMGKLITLIAEDELTLHVNLARRLTRDVDKTLSLLNEGDIVDIEYKDRRMVKVEIMGDNNGLQ